MSDWGAPDVQEWKEEARAMQQNIFLLLGDQEWDEFDRRDERILQRRVGFCLYAFPENPPVGNNLGYNQEQFNNIRFIANGILRNARRGNIIHFGCVFVFGKIWENRFKIPVFKVKGEQNQTLYVDSDCYVYNAWEDYLDSNRLPKCMYCYPRDGLYQGNYGQVLVDFGTSPACDFRNRFVSVLMGDPREIINFTKVIIKNSPEMAALSMVLSAMVEGGRRDFMLNWDSQEVQEWKVEAQAMQQNLYLHLGDRDWDEWDKSDEAILLRKVGFGLYGLPENIPEENNLGYNQEQLENIKRIADVILKNAERGNIIHFACIFVFGRTLDIRFNVPVFKIKGKRNQTLFVDTDCRVYQDWQNYLDSNCLPQCMYCYPRDGLYQGNEGQVLVDFGTSPACDLISRIFSSLDSLAKVVRFASTSARLASLLSVPIAVPYLAVASIAADVYCATRHGMTLRDRHLHGQSIDLDNPESRVAWLGITGTVLRLAERGVGGTISRSAAAGEVPTEALCITYDILKVGNLTVNGLGIINGFISLCKKDTLTFLDIYQFSASVLFFGNNLLNIETAERIIQNTQQQVLNRHYDNLTAAQREGLFRLLDQVQGRTQLHQNANRINVFNRINDRQSFYESLVTPRSDL